MPPRAEKLSEGPSSARQRLLSSQHPRQSRGSFGPLGTARNHDATAPQDLDPVAPYGPLASTRTTTRELRERARRFDPSERRRRHLPRRVFARGSRRGWGLWEAIRGEGMGCPSERLAPLARRTFSDRLQAIRPVRSSVEGHPTPPANPRPTPPPPLPNGRNRPRRICSSRLNSAAPALHTVKGKRGISAPRCPSTRSEDQCQPSKTARRASSGGQGGTHEEEAGPRRAAHGIGRLGPTRGGLGRIVDPTPSPKRPQS